MDSMTLLADSAGSERGDVLFGILMSIGIIWSCAWLVKPKPKGYRFQSETRGSVVPRR